MDFVRLLIYLSIGTLAMLVPIMIQGAWYNIKWVKRILVAVLLTLVGTLGTFLLFFIENGKFGGISFFGAVFFIPVIFVFVAKILDIKFDVLMDLSAPAECMMLAIMKIQCFATGCCGGRLITFAGKEFVFPSQLVELIDALLICILLMVLSRKIVNKGKLYPYYMIAYGTTRFILNIFRKAKVMKFLFIPFGNFWSLISIAIGVVWLGFLWKKEKKFTKRQK